MIWVIGIMAAVIVSLFIVVIAQAAYAKELQRMLNDREPLAPVIIKR